MPDTQKPYRLPVVLRWLLGAIPVALLLVIVFVAGMRVGYREARFSHASGENYEHIFSRPEGFLDMRSENAHGVFGTVVGVADNVITVVDAFKTERSVTISSSTIMRSGANSAEATDARAGNKIVVFGDPNDAGQIAARFIRLFP